MCLCLQLTPHDYKMTQGQVNHTHRLPPSIAVMSVNTLRYKPDHAEFDSWETRLEPSDSVKGQQIPRYIR